MQRFVFSFLLIVLTACNDSGSKPKRPDRPNAPAQQPMPTAPVVPGPTPPPAPTEVGGENPVPEIGNSDTFEFGTWNIENFPKSDRTVDIAGEVVKKTNVDVMALEEVASEIAFQQLLDELPGFSGVLSPHKYDRGGSYQKLAFIYREADLELLDWELLFEGDEQPFPRPPLLAHFKIKTGSRAGQEIYMIAVHLKATLDGNSQERRAAANKALEAYVGDLTARVPGAQVTLLGDFNERVTWPAGLDVFKPWTDKPESYTFQTKPLALAGEYSFISPSRPMLDHVISTRNMELSPITIPKLETMISSYRDLVSDHLPIMARLP